MKLLLWSQQNGNSQVSRADEKKKGLVAFAVGKRRSLACARVNAQKCQCMCKRVHRHIHVSHSRCMLNQTLIRKKA